MPARADQVPLAPDPLQCPGDLTENPDGSSWHHDQQARLGNRRQSPLSHCRQTLLSRPLPQRRAFCHSPSGDAEKEKNRAYQDLLVGAAEWMGGRASSWPELTIEESWQQ